MYRKKIVFVTGTRADYGKLKSLIFAVSKYRNFSLSVFVTGMHNLKKYGFTFEELKKDKIQNYYRYENQRLNDSMDIILSKTIKGFNKFIKKEKPDLVVVHGDRVEPLGCAIVCSLNNILLAHIEGGEVSGTVDEMLRHSISKLAHLHFVSNTKARKRLIQMGENKENIFTIGSPDIDIMKSRNLPKISDVQKRYGFDYKEYGIVLFHPVTTEIKILEKQADILCKSINKSKKHFIIIYPNNDFGSDIILKKYFKKLKNNKLIKIFPSMRFEHFLTLLKGSKVIIGNSSAAVREAPFYGINTINLGTRQYKRTSLKSIINLNFNENKIITALKNVLKKILKIFVQTNLVEVTLQKKFIQIIKSKNFFNTSKQKVFRDI